MVLGDKRHCRVAVTLPDFPGCPSLVVFHWESWHVWISPIYAGLPVHQGWAAWALQRLLAYISQPSMKDCWSWSLALGEEHRFSTQKFFGGDFKKVKKVVATAWSQQLFGFVFCFCFFTSPAELHPYPSNTQQITFFLVAKLLTSIQASLIFEVHVFLNCDKDHNFLFPFVESKLI